MSVTMEEVQKIRQESGAGVMDSKKALEEAGGDYKKALDILKKRGAIVAAKKAARSAEQGLIEAYVHGKGKIGVLAEVNCETDFVARNPEFQELAHDIALQVSAMKPASVEELLAQPYIKDDSITIKDLINSKVGKLGENIRVKRFIRYELGE